MVTRPGWWHLRSPPWKGMLAASTGAANSVRHVNMAFSRADWCRGSRPQVDFDYHPNIGGILPTADGGRSVRINNPGFFPSRLRMAAGCLPSQCGSRRQRNHPGDDRGQTTVVAVHQVADAVQRQECADHRQGSREPGRPARPVRRATASVIMAREPGLSRQNRFGSISSNSIRTVPVSGSSTRSTRA